MFKEKEYSDDSVKTLYRATKDNRDSRITIEKIVDGEVWSDPSKPVCTLPTLFHNSSYSKCASKFGKEVYILEPMNEKGMLNRKSEREWTFCYRNCERPACEKLFRNRPQQMKIEECNCIAPQISDLFGPKKKSEGLHEDEKMGACIFSCIINHYRWRLLWLIL